MKIITWKIKLCAKLVTIKVEEKTTKTPLPKINNQKLIKSTITLTTNLMFQHVKVTPMLLYRSKKGWEDFLHYKVC